MADLFDADSSEKKTPVKGGRRAPISMYGDGLQLSPNISHHLMQPSSGVDQSVSVVHSGRLMTMKN